MHVRSLNIKNYLRWLFSSYLKLKMQLKKYDKKQIKIK